MQVIASHILIHATQITHNQMGDKYEFILDYHLNIVESIKLNIGQETDLYGILFELNHVRINPVLDNTGIIARLTNRLAEIGVKVSNQPQATSMAICYKPMGEIKDKVRFYLNKERKLVFLSPITRPRLVYSRPKT